MENKHKTDLSSAPVIPPIFMNNLERRGILKRYPAISLPIQIVLCGTLLVFATPMCCAIFPQKSSLPMIEIEPELRLNCKDPSSVCYFNKGL